MTAHSSRRHPSIQLLETLESRLLLSGTHGLSDLQNTWALGGFHYNGDIDFGSGVGTIDGGSVYADTGANATIGGMSYSVLADGSVTLMPGTNVQGVLDHNFIGAINTRNDIVALAAEDLPDTYHNDADFVILISNSGAGFTTADLVGTFWATEEYGRGLVTFDGAGNIIGGRYVGGDGSIETIPSGNYTVSPTGEFEATFHEGDGDKVFHGLLNESRDVAAMVVDDIAAAVVDGDTRMVMLVKSSGKYSLADFSGTWTISGKDVRGSVTSDGSGHLTGNVTDSDGSQKDIAGTYLVTPAGQVTLAMKVTDLTGTFNVNLIGAINASRNVATLTDTARDLEWGEASPVMLVQSSNHAPRITRLPALSGAVERNAYTVDIAALLAGSDAADFDADDLGFRVGVLSNGTLTVNGVPAVAGQTVIAAGDTVLWTPAAGAKGLVSPFTLQAWDGMAPSAATIPVKITTSALPMLTVTASPATISEGSAKVCTFTVTRTGPTNDPLVISYDIDGSAIPGTDFDLGAISLSIPAGVSSIKQTFTVREDTRGEGTETVVLELLADAVNPDYKLGPKTSATVTITDNEPVVTIQRIKDASEKNPVTTGKGQFQVRRTGGSTAADLVVYYTVSGGVAGHFQPLSGFVTIPAGKTMANIDVIPVSDATADGTMNVVVTLDGSDPTDGYSLSPKPAQQTATVKIADFDVFAGNRAIKMRGDDNLRDGIQLQDSTFPGVTTRIDATHLTVAGKGMTFPMIQDGYFLHLQTSPTVFPTWQTPNTFYASDGVNGALVTMGQEAGDPTDISINVSAWTSATTPVTPAMLVGSWQASVREDSDLRANPADPFTENTWVFTLTDLGGGNIQLDFQSGSTGTLLLKLVGHQLVFVSGPAGTSFSNFQAYTDGSRIAFAWIASAEANPTIIQAGIGLGAKT